MRQIQRKSGFVRKVDKELGVPLHIQMSNIIREMIEVDDLVEGDYLLPERVIGELQEISRMTVNKAIATLVAEGLLIRHQGKGTIVAPKRSVSRYEELDSFSRRKKEVSNEITNKILSFKQLPVTKWIRKKLSIPEHVNIDTVYKIRRLRYIDGEPLSMESIYLDERKCPELTLQMLENYSMRELYIKKYEYQLGQLDQVIRPTILNEEQSEQLDQEKGDLALRIYRHLYTQDGEVMEYREIVFLSQKHDFKVVTMR